MAIHYNHSRKSAQSLAEQIRGNGGKAIAVQGDVSKAADIEKLFAETKKAYGKVDVLVNNAGIYEFSPLEAVTAEHFHKQFDLNVLGLLLTTQAAVTTSVKTARVNACVMSEKKTPLMRIRKAA